MPMFEYHGVHFRVEGHSSKGDEALSEDQQKNLIRSVSMKDGGMVVELDVEHVRNAKIFVSLANGVENEENEVGYIVARCFIQVEFLCTLTDALASAGKRPPNEDDSKGGAEKGLTRHRRRTKAPPWRIRH